MVRNAHVNYYFAELIAGRVGHKECFYKTILTSPYWLLSRRLKKYSAAGTILGDRFYSWLIF